jgi:hypothetical protein
VRDPVPGEAPAKPAKRRAAAPAVPPKPTKKHISEAAEELETWIALGALMWGWQAPPCGDALESAAPDIAEKVAKLLARNPAWLAKVREGGILADILAVVGACKPVATVAWGYYTRPRAADGGPGVDLGAFPAYGAGNGAPGA